MSKSILDTAEVIHDYMRNGDRSTSREECITWIARLIQEVSQQAPSATVDLPAIKTLFVKWCNAKTEDTHSNAMTLNAFAVAVAELLHSQQPTVDEITFLATLNVKTETFTFSDITVSGIMNNEIWAKGILLSAQGLNNPDVKISVIQHSQQPTVDVETIARECVESLEEAKLLEVSALTERINLSDREDAVRIVSKALTEALRGSYTREDMIAFLMKYSGLLNPSNRIAKERVSKWLDQYDTERGK